MIGYNRATKLRIGCRIRWFNFAVSKVIDFKRHFWIKTYGPVLIKLLTLAVTRIFVMERRLTFWKKADFWNIEQYLSAPQIKILSKFFKRFLKSYMFLSLQAVAENFLSNQYHFPKVVKHMGTIFFLQNLLFIRTSDLINVY